ncbi:MAG: peptidylprolyl isomerase [Candidatus Amulumruptor caecigallinarius]|uniref:Peptidylprolyl isomerase n=1 Tax=Candidatus Amulumruptor caecigallinarius TaxID=2109911 RepID=A0A4Q0U8K6_9BACT|nr:MAG: peptidylprolyl isomerase [Candidatus Amulumruptor caecigallinarius]HJE38683.1 peptidylprolyl isomerase [Candidatus Amulumruptor caecigallinarius]
MPALIAMVGIVAYARDNNIVEEVAWVVGDEPIWRSQIEEAYDQYKYENASIQGNPYCFIPERLAVEKLYLHQADIDTIEIQESLVASQVESRINYFTANLGTREKVEQYFRKSLPDIRAELIENMRNSSRIRQVQENLTSDLKITPSDVRKYFDDLPEDSVPYVPTQVEVQIITINPVIPREEIEDVKARLREYADQVNNGEREFSTLAILYSEDQGSAVRGGEIGYLGRANLDPAYAAVAFNLSDPKRVSKIVESQYGYHIIQLIDKRGDRVNTRHILLRPKVSDQALTDAIGRMDSLRTDMVDNKKFTFEEAARYISSDKDTRNNNGIMVNEMTGNARFEMKQLPQEVSRKVADMQPGDISEPFIMKDPRKNNDIIAMVKLTARIPGHKANIADDYQTIKSMYENAQKAKILKDWLDKKIASTYVRIEDGWRDCEFEHQGWLKNTQQSTTY